MKPIDHKIFERSCIFFEGFFVVLGLNQMREKSQ